MLLIKNHIIFNKYSIFSFVSAVLLLLLGYFSNNLPIFTGENLDQQYVSQIICEKFGIEEKMDYDSVTLFNVSNDKQLAYSCNVDGDTIKSTAITDRRKLLHILELLQKSNSYKYIILDMMFCKGDSTKYDDELFSLIMKMDRIVLVEPTKQEIADVKLRQKAAIAEYYSTITSTNFTRYEYMRGDKRYLPLFVYEELHPNKKIQRYGWRWLSFYFSEGRLCQNTIFLTFDSQDFTDKALIDSLKEVSVYYNIGEDILLNIDEAKPTLTENAFIQRMKTLNKGKYVIIGNFLEDVHDTYAGTKPGSLILMRAIQSLDSNKHIISFFYILFWLVVYFIISLFICTGRSLMQYVPYIRNTKYKIVHYFADVLSFGALFFVIEVAEYAICHTLHSLIVPTIYYSLLKLWFHYKNFEK